jgi:trimeric autotransporter adhesin
VNLMTVEDKNFNIKNGLSVGSGKHQILDSNGRISANYFTLHAGGRYLSAGVDLYDLIATTGIPPVSTDSWNYIHDVVSLSSDQWDAAFSFVNADSATNNTTYNRTNYINITGGVVEQDFGVQGDTYLEGNVRVDGELYLSAATYVENDVYVMGNLRADGDVWLATESVYPKTVYVGATDDDNIVFVANVSSNITPNASDSYDLGTSTQQWRELFIQDISASNDIFIDNDLLVSANGTIGNDFRVSGTTTIGGNTTLSGTLDVDDATYVYDTLDVELDTHLHSNLFVTNNTTISGNTTLSGTLDVESITTLHDDLIVSGNTHIVGDLRVDGNAYLSAGVDGIINVGNTNTDNVVFHADIDSGLTPNSSTTFDLGSNTQQWRELFVKDVSASNDVFVDNDLLVSANGTIREDFRVSGHTTIGGNTTLSGTLDVDDATYVYDTLDVELDTHLHDDLYVTNNTTVSGNTVLSGTLDVKDFVTFYDDLSVRGDLYVDGNAYLSAGIDGNIYVGDTNTDNVIFNADVDSGIKPDDNITFDLGSSTQQWRELFVHDISASNDISIDNDLLVSANGTIGNDFRVSGHMIVAGSTTLSGTLDVDDATYVHDTLDVELDTRLHSDLFVTDNTTISGNTTLSGTLDVDDATYVYDTLDVELDTRLHSNLFVTDNTTISGNTTLSGTLDVDGATYVYDALDVELDTRLHSDLFVTNNTTISGNTTLSGTLDVKRDTNLHENLFVAGSTTISGNTHMLGDLRVDGNAFLSAGVDGIINVGNVNTDNVVFHADIDSGITPNNTTTYDLGKSSQQWRTLYVQDISATGNATIDRNLAVSGYTMISGNTMVSGNTTLSGALDVDDATYVHDTLDVELDTRLHSNLYTTGDTTISGNTTLSGTLDVDDATYVHDTLDVELDTRLHSNLFVTDNTTISGNTTLSGTLDVDDATYVHDTLDVELDTHIHSNLFVTDNTTISGGTVLSGTLDVKDFTTLHDDLSVKGDLYVDGNAYLSAGVDGSIYVGDTNTDNVVFNADVDSNIKPDDNVTFDLGTSTQQWRELFVKDISASNDVFVDNDLTIQGHTSANGGMSLTGDLTASDDVFIKGSIVVEGHAYFGFGSDSSQINIGDPNVDEIIFNADVGSDILPYPSNTYNLGSASRRWLTVYTNDLHTKNNVLSEGNITTHGYVRQIDQYDTQKSVSTTQKIWRAESGSNTDQVISVSTFQVSECNSVRYEILVINAEGTTTLNADYLHDANEIVGTQYGRVSIGTDPVNDVDCTLISGELMISLNVKHHSKIMITGTSMLLI